MKMYRTARKTAMLGFLLLALGAVTAAGQIYTPVNICATAQVLNEYGEVLAGSAEAGPMGSSLVQVYWASNGVIYPPAVDGTADFRNAPVEGGTAFIGHLTATHLDRPGIFSVTLANPRPTQNSRVFVRVFNAPTLVQASFYGDSPLLQVRDNDVLIAEISGTTTPLDAGDQDGDGVNNSWEESMGSNSNRDDSDQDGVADGEEFAAGTSLTDPLSYLAISSITLNGNGEFVIGWDAASGREYNLQHRAEQPTEAGSYTNVVERVHGSGEAAEVESSVEAGRYGIFRLRLSD